MTATFKISRSFQTHVQATPNVSACAAAFGIGLNEAIEIRLYEDLPVRLGPGRIVYLTGESGAGKSCAMSDIRAAVAEDDRFAIMPHVDIEDCPKLPLLDQFEGWGLEEVGGMLALVGISEPFVYLRKPDELSDGQRYRFYLAQMIYQARQSAIEGVTPIIFVDEFLAFLDRRTAKNVAYQTRRVASRFGLAFVLASTHDDMIHDLQPNQTITLRLNLQPAVVHSPMAGK